MNDFEIIRKNWDHILQSMKEEHDILPVSFDTWLKQRTAHHSRTRNWLYQVSR